MIDGLLSPIALAVGQVATVFDMYQHSHGEPEGAHLNQVPSCILSDHWQDGEVKPRTKWLSRLQ